MCFILNYITHTNYVKANFTESCISIFLHFLPMYAICYIYRRSRARSSDRHVDVLNYKLFFFSLFKPRLDIYAQHSATSFAHRKFVSDRIIDICGCGLSIRGFPQRRDSTRAVCDYRNLISRFLPPLSFHAGDRRGPSTLTDRAVRVASSAERMGKESNALETVTPATRGPLGKLSIPCLNKSQFRQITGRVQSTSRNTPTT